MFDIYLDDMRKPPEGWKLVATIEEVKAYLRQGLVNHLSLDHDLGACDACLEQVEPRAGYSTRDEWLTACQTKWLTASEFSQMPNCTHFGNGQQLCLWMAEHGIWPKQKPTVHSANATGAANMRATIDRYYGTTPEDGWKRLSV